MKLIKKICIVLAALCCFLTTACTQLKFPCNPCVDNNRDHICDECGEKKTGCKDGNKDHVCDVCGVAVSTHVDADDNHYCDICTQVVSGCTDTDNNHYCDTCFKEISVCVDSGNGSCGVCGSAIDFVDYEALTNAVATEYMRGIVTIYIQARSWGDWETISMSSGVVYDYDTEKQVNYVLTNNHSVARYYEYQQSGYQMRISVYDVHEEGYEAAVVCRDAAYDLAVLKIVKTEEDVFHYFDFAEENPTVGQKVACLGHPEGQKNALTYGSVLGYDECNLHDQSSSVEFDCINHNAWMLQGSSGGLLMSTDGKIVGINFAVSTSKTGGFLSGWSIPVQQVKQFLAANESAFSA